MRLAPKRRWGGIGRIRRPGVRRISVLLWISITAPTLASGQSTNVLDLRPEELKGVQVYSASYGIPLGISVGITCLQVLDS